MEEIKTINIKDKEYPKLLKKIPDRPENLYIKGELNLDELCFGVVGTRRCSSYGKQVALEIAGDLAEAGLTIVSGLAPGIDTFSHQAVVERTRLRPVLRSKTAEGDQGFGLRPTKSSSADEVGGRAIAVLGTGIDEKSIYPQSNIKLARKILETGGALISEYPPGTRGTQFTFPQRNRIISGLSIGVLVIEAKEKSGALITANWAFKQEREVFAIPGQIFSSNSRGCHYLIKKGAKLAENANDILKELNLPQKELISFYQGENEEENLILEALKEEALYIDKITEKTKLPAATVASTLAILEIKGKIRNLGGGIYSLQK